MKTKEAFVHDNCGEICEAKEFGIHCPTHGELGPDDFTVKDVSSDNATPRPWKVGTRNPGRVMTDFKVIAQTDFIDESHPTSEHEANARLIVRAVNAHDELLAACKLALTFSREGCPDPGCLVCQQHDAETAQLKAAIALAEAE